MSDQLDSVRINMIKALRDATTTRRLDWIRTNPDEVRWKEGTVEQRYAMISQEGVFATFSRMRDGSMELVIQVQETGAYREYEVTRTDGVEVEHALNELFKVLPSTAKMIEDFQLIVARLESPEEL